MKGCNYTFHDYGIQDMYAVKTFLLENYPQLPLFFFGHSAGGQQMGLMKDMDGIQGMVGYAVSTGYLPHMPIGYRILSAYFFFIFSPVSIFLTGFVNAKRFGIMEDLPKKVVQEWRAWCLRKHYLFDEKFYGNTIPKGHYQKLNFPIHIYWATDDPISNERSVPTFWSNVNSTKGIEFTSLNPAKIEEKEIGHFGFFKKRFKEKLWKKGLDKLEEFYQNSEPQV